MRDTDLQSAGQHSWWQRLYDRLSQAAPEAEDDVNEICTPQQSFRPHSCQYQSRADIPVHDVDCSIAYYPPEIIFESSASRPRRSASPRAQKDLGATEPVSFVYNEVNNSVQLSKSYEEPQTSFAANTHRDFHLTKPNLPAINALTRYETGSSQPTSPVRLQSHEGSSKLRTTQGEDGGPFSSDIRGSKHFRGTAAIPRGHRDEAFLVSPYHSTSIYPATDPTKPLAGSTDPLPSDISRATHLGPSTNSPI